MPTNGVATNGDITPNAATSPLCTIGGGKRTFTPIEKESIRLIGQHLTSLGLQHTCEVLCAESGCRVEDSVAASFRSHVMDGDWNKALGDMTDLESVVGKKEDIAMISSLLLEEKYFELLEEGDKFGALKCLRMEISPLASEMERVHELTGFAMHSNPETLYKAAGWPGVKGGARELLMDKLHVFMPASFMVPPRRLKDLLQQALDQQVSKCLYHNTSLRLSVDEGKTSLFSDHRCGKDSFPAYSQESFHGHSDEVWYCTWSHDGSILASCSKDGSVVLWKYQPDSAPPLVKLRQLSGHRKGASFCAFSGDGKYLLVCGSNEPQDAKVWNVESGEITAQIRTNNDDCYTTGAWFGNSTEFIVASVRGHFLLCNIEGAVVHTWDGIRVHSVAIAPSSTKWVLAADSHKRVRRYDFSAEVSHDILTEDFAVMSMSVSQNGRYVLLNLANQGIHLWDVFDRVLVRKFQGLTQGTYTIYSCFGGVNDDFIASGSEDGKVYIWHRSTSQPLCCLTGHLRSVNCVAWNPRYPDVLASASDDETIRVWVPRPCDAEEEEDGSSDKGDRLDGMDRLFSFAGLDNQGDPEN